jgi:hypothetical protein
MAMILQQIGVSGNRKERTMISRLSWIGFALVSVSYGQNQSAIPAIQADMETRTVRRLADGNVIEQSVTTHYYRDSAGRTRLETPYSIAISDPVLRFAAILDPKKRIARLTDLAPLPNARVAPSDPNRSRPGADLGTLAIQGFETEGRSFTISLPANTIGNLKPIDQTLEVWYAKELQFPMLRKSSDPMNGESTERVTSVLRLTEVSPSLFVIPSDYQVQKMPAVSSGSLPNIPRIQ